jgi:cell division protease FtsH
MPPPAPPPRPPDGSRTPRPSSEELRKRQLTFNLVFLAAALGFLVVVNALGRDAIRPETVSYSRFLQAMDQEVVVEVAISPRAVVWKEPDPGADPAGVATRSFRATRVPGVDDRELVARLHAMGAEMTGEVPSDWWPGLLLWMLPLVILLGVWIWLIRRMAGGRTQALTFGASRAKIWDESTNRVTFDDVAGVDEAVAELREVVDFLKNPQRYLQMGARIPKGVLLVGPTGTGKTLLARATAGEAGVPFFTISGADFVEMFVGVGAARVRDLFRQAREKAPCIVFIDEIDTVGKTRAGAGSPVSNEEREQTLNQLLVEMDGFDSSTGVILMAATNRPDLLDPALQRPGRFDRQVAVDRPDLVGREAILRIHARRVTLAPEVDLRVVAARTPGFAGAQLANVINEAALLAVRKERDQVTMDDLDEAVDRVLAGLERSSRALIEREREIVAHHEMGHALMGLLLPHADPVHKVSIVPRGATALGVTIQTPLEDRYLLTEAELLDRLTVLLGGRAAEQVVYGETSTGAADDLQRATELARRMVTQFGMAEGVGPVALEDGGGPWSGNGFPGVRRFSEETARRIDGEVRRLVEEGHERAVRLLSTHQEALRTLATELQEGEVMDGAELERRVQELGLPVQEKPAARRSRAAPSRGAPRDEPPPSPTSADPDPTSQP